MVGPTDAQRGAATCRGLRVVLIDDDPDIHTVVAAMFGRTDGVDLVGSAHDTATGLTMATEQQPHVVLLDLQLGAENGAEVVGPLLRSCPRTMVAAFSALPASGHEDRLRRLGAFAYYPKTSLTALPELIRRDHALFSVALDGEDVLAPATNETTSIRHAPGFAR